MQGGLKRRRLFRITLHTTILVSVIFMLAWSVKSVCKKNALNVFLSSSGLGLEVIMPICEICSEDVASEAEMRTHLLIHLENEMPCPFCSLSGVSYDELSLHINTAHAEMPSTSSVEGSVTHRGPACTENRGKRRTVTRKERHWAESLPPGTPSIQTLMPVAESSADASVGSVCGANSRPTTHSTESGTHTKNTKERQESLEEHVALKQKRLSSPLKGTEVWMVAISEYSCSSYCEGFRGWLVFFFLPEKLFPCPMCSLVCRDGLILQEHVELHLQEQTINEGKGVPFTHHCVYSSYTIKYTVQKQECSCCISPQVQPL